MRRRDDKKKKAAGDERPPDKNGAPRKASHWTGDDVTTVEDRRYALTAEPHAAAEPDDFEPDCY